MNKKIIEIFENKGWGLYKHSRNIKEMIYTGYENIRLEAGLHYDPLPLTSEPTNPNIVLNNIQKRVKDYKNDDSILNRLPYFINVKTLSNNDIKVNGIYLINSVVYGVKQINLLSLRSMKWRIKN